MKITTKDIARLAGVSRGTVDRALNNRGQIAQEVKERILQIANEHGYSKNTLASSLARNTKHRIAIVLPNPDQDPYWQMSVRGICRMEAHLRNHGIELRYEWFDTADPQSFLNVTSKALSYKPSAVLTAPIFLNESLQFVRLARENDIPLLCINSELNDASVPFYGQNSYEAGRLAGQLFDIKGLTSGEILTITLGHHATNAIHIDNKIKGLKAYLLENESSLRVTEFALEGYEDPVILQRASAQILEDYPAAKGVIFMNSRAHLLAEHSDFFLTISPEITAIGFDLIPGNIELLKIGHLDFLLNQNPRRQGETALNALFDHFVHGTPIDQKKYLPLDIVVKENYKNYLEN